MFKILLLIFITTSPAYAFINIESLRSNAKPGLNTSGKILFNQQTGNTEKILGAASTLNSYLKDKDEYIFIANMRYGESFKQKDTEDGALHLRYTRNLKESHFAEIYTQYQHNKFKALTARELVGLGYRYAMASFSGGIGAFKEHEIIEDRPNEDGYRGNMYLSYGVKNETGFEFSTILYYQPSLSQGEDTRTILNTGISQKVTKSINLIIEFQNVYDQRPPSDIKTYDSSLMFGVNFI